MQGCIKSATQSRYARMHKGSHTKPLHDATAQMAVKAQMQRLCVAVNAQMQRHKWLTKQGRGNPNDRNYSLRAPRFSLRITSCEPPSTILVEETRVSFAFFWKSGMLRQPQLHIVERTFDSERVTLSFKLPA